MIKEEHPVRYWGDYEDVNDESFWVYDSMQSLVGIIWAKHFRNNGKIIHNVTMTLDRERGVIVAEVSYGTTL